jgi:hypothetical protein
LTDLQPHPGDGRGANPAILVATIRAPCLNIAARVAHHGRRGDHDTDGGAFPPGVPVGVIAAVLRSPRVELYERGRGFVASSVHGR